MNQSCLKLLKEFGKQYDVDYRILLANLFVENRDLLGFNPADGSIRKRFESNVYLRFRRMKFGPGEAYKDSEIDVRWIKKHYLDTGWIKRHTDHQLFRMSFSLGLPQIMVYHYPLMGYKSPDEMWEDFEAGEIQQVQAYLVFILNYRKVDQDDVSNYMRALRDKNLSLIAEMYNGSNYKQNNYDGHMKQFIRKYKE